MDECESRRVFTIAVTNAPSVFAATQALVEGSTYVRAALGLHPELVSSHGAEVSQFLLALDHTRFIGEIGLDYVTIDRDVRAKQRDVLRQVLERCALAGDKIITLHSRRAATDVIDAVGAGFPGHAILHWYSGSLQDLKKAANYGFYFSVNPRMMLSESSMRLIDAMPRTHLLLETDGPFVKIGNRPAEPHDTRVVVDRLAVRWRLPMEELASLLFQNFRRLLDSASAARW